MTSEVELEKTGPSTLGVAERPNHNQEVQRKAGTIIVVLFALVGLIAASCGDDDTVESGPATTGAPTATTTTSTTSVPPSPTTTSTTSSTTTAAQPEPPDGAPAPEAGPGGGSGEIAVRWRAVERAMGYRVERASTPTGTFEISGEIDVTSGRTTLGSGVTNLWSPTVDTFEYIEVLSGEPSTRYYRVIAYNDAGDGPSSAVACGAPSGAPSSC